MKTKQPKVKMQKYTLTDFEKQFPNDDVCLNGSKITFTQTVSFAKLVKKLLITIAWHRAKVILANFAAITFTRQPTLSITNQLRRYVFGFMPFILWLPPVAASLPNN